MSWHRCLLKAPQKRFAPRPRGAQRQFGCVDAVLTFCPYFINHERFEVRGQRWAYL